MITVRKSAERGTTVLDWLDSKHTFSFADYHDPQHMNFGALRVINEDIVAPAKGFGTHPHRDMEILTFIISGALEHKDNMGNGTVIRRGEVQRMSAGTGVMHSEFNHSQTEPVHLLQIWILPESRGITPSYEQIQFECMANTLQVVASNEVMAGALTIHQQARMAVSTLQAGRSLKYRSKYGSVWIQVVDGELSISGTNVRAGDGLAITETSEIEITAQTDSEILLFDLIGNRIAE